MRATGNQSLNETLWQESKAGWHGRWCLALVQTPARPCWNNPLRERKSRKRFHLLYVLFGCSVRSVQVFYVSPCLLSLRHSRRSLEGRSAGSCSLPHLDLDVTMDMGRGTIGICLCPINHFEYGLATLTACLAASVHLCIIRPVFLFQCWITLFFSWYDCLLKHLMQSHSACHKLTSTVLVIISHLFGWKRCQDQYSRILQFWYKNPESSYLCFDGRKETVI